MGNDAHITGTHMRLAKAILVAMSVVVTPLAAQKPDPKADVMATVRQFLDGFNKGDMKSAAAACAVPISIIDEFPPHLWQGPNACMDWSPDFDINAKANAITDPVVKITSVSLVDVTGDRAYVVTKTSYD